MNDQLAGQLRQYLQIIATSLTTLGVVSATTANLWVGIIMATFGIITMGTSLYLAWRANTKESIAASFAQNQSVKKVEVTDPKLAEVIKNADPTTEVKVSTQ